MNIIPRNKYVLVKPESEGKKTDSGLVIPDTNEEEQKSQGIVEAVSKDLDVEIKKGDKVIYGAFAGEVIEDKKTKEIYNLVHEEDIIAFIK